MGTLFRLSGPLLIFLLLLVTSCADLQYEEKSKPQENIEVLMPQEGTPNLAESIMEVPDFESQVANVVQSSAANGPNKRFKKVFINKKAGSKAGPNGAPVVDNFADAVERVESGGTITVFPGTYQIDVPVEINRPMTIEARKGTNPVVINDTTVALFVRQVTGGPVLIKDLNFKNLNAFASIVIISSADVTISGSSFDSGTSNGSGVFTTANVPTKVMINESHFSGGVAGTWAGGIWGRNDIELNVHKSTFKNHGRFAIQYQIGAFGTVSENDISDCGFWGCVRARFTENVIVKNNVLSDDISQADGANGFFHHIVFFGNATGEIDNNLFDGCGYGQCLAGSIDSDISVTNNEFRVYEDHYTRFVIVSSDGFASGNPISNVVASDNTITGIGGNAQNDPSNDQAYAIKLGGLLVEQGSTMRAYRNTISNAAAGIKILSAGNLTEATDNTISKVRTGISGFDLSGLGNATANLNSNDITEYYASIDISSFDANTDMTCNWWGTDQGPQNVNGAPASFYTPWATESVAGSSVTSCSGGL